ncbi:MAG TPA: hypothetical protein VLG92_03335 [Candidatus Saccharimonadia bacterium]|nr:hypothetical protein [Candidatus Saccharimonadia bacterium]
MSESPASANQRLGKFAYDGLEDGEAYRRNQACLQMGEMPGVGSGFSFVINNRAQGHEHELIPPDEYAYSFSLRQIPIAGPYDKQHLHDVGHIAGYQRLFDIGLAADLVQASAANAYLLGLCVEFADSMDRLGDAMNTLNVASPLFRRAHSFMIVKRVIPLTQRLVALLPPSFSTISQTGGPDKTIVNDILDELLLGLNEHYTAYDNRMAAPGTAA